MPSSDPQSSFVRESQSGPARAPRDRAVILVAALLVIAAMTVFAVQWLGRNETKPNLLLSSDNANDVQPGDAPQIGLEVLAERMADEPDLYILDVQEREGYLTQHIPGSVNIPFEELQYRVEEIPRSRDVIVTCIGNDVQPCALSTKAAGLLQEEGFTYIYDFRGGVTAWKEAGLPIITDQEILVRAVQVNELKRLVDDREPIVLLDVRDSETYQAGALPSAQNVAFDGLQKEILRIPRDQNVYIYADTEGRAKLFADELVRNGYIYVAYLVGGVAQWRASGYELVSMQ